MRRCARLTIRVSPDICTSSVDWVSFRNDLVSFRVVNRSMNLVGSVRLPAKRNIHAVVAPHSLSACRRGQLIFLLVVLQAEAHQLSLQNRIASGPYISGLGARSRFGVTLSEAFWFGASLQIRSAKLLLGASWVIISGVIRRVTVIITQIKGFITPCITTHEPPSRVPFRV